MTRHLSFLLLALTLLAWAPAGAQESPAPDAATAEVSSGAQAPTGQDAGQDAGPDYQAWDAVATRAEAALEANRASDQALLELRQELVEWRSQFDAVAQRDDVLIATLKSQIATLGPPPADGQTEPEIITQRRDELEQQLAEVEAPRKAAEEARSRADALIRAIDATLRARQTDALFQIGPSPLNVAAWPAAISDLSTTLRAAWAEVAAAWGTDVQKTELKRDLPLVILYVVLALALLTRGRAWVIRFGAGIRSHSQGHLRGVWGFILSLGQVAAPLAGIYALVAAANRAGILGLRGQVLADNLPVLGLSTFVAAWLGNRVFGVGIGTWSILNLNQHQRTEGRVDATLLGLFYGLFLSLKALAEYEGWPDQTRVVLAYPLLVGAAVVLVRLGHLLRQHAVNLSDDSDEGSFFNRILALTGQVVMLAGILGPVLGAVGYETLAEGFVYRTGMTLALVGGLAVLHRFYTNLYGLVMRLDQQAASDALVPVLASFLTFLVVLPLVALIWGARVVDLWEAWDKIKQGITIGSTRISPAEFFTFLVVFFIGFALTRLIQGLLRTTVLPKTRLDIGGRNAITAGVGYLGIILAAVIAITSAGIDLSSLAIVAGALSVGIGFGLQNVVSNFVSGIILLIERPVSEGDWIEVGGQQGYVRDIAVRSTRIETFDRADVIVPNADLISGQVTNFTRGNLIGRVKVPVGVAYGTDTKQVESILRDIAEAHPLVTVNPPPTVLFRGFGADALEFEIRAILKDVNYILSVHSDMNHEIARRFAEAGIEIPFSQRDIWFRNPETLRASLAPQGAARPAPGAGQGGAQGAAGTGKDGDGSDTGDAEGDT